MATLEEAVAAINDRVVSTSGTSQTLDVAYLSKSVDLLRGTVTQASIESYAQQVKDDLDATVAQHFNNVQGSVGLRLQTNLVVASNGDIANNPSETWITLGVATRAMQHSRSQFSFALAERNTLLGEFRIRVIPFQIHQTTGAISIGTETIVLHNTSSATWGSISFGYCGDVCLAWGQAAWGTNSTMYYGGCTWLVNSDNTVTIGQNTGNTSYTVGNDLGNGNIPMIRVGGSVQFYIPTASSADSHSRANGGVIDSTTGNFTSLPSLTGGYDSGSTSAYGMVLRDVSQTVSESSRIVYTTQHLDNSVWANHATALSKTTLNTVVGNRVLLEDYSATSILFGYTLSNGDTIYTGAGGEFWINDTTNTLATATVASGGEFNAAGLVPPYGYPSFVNGGIKSTSEPDTFYIMSEVGYFYKLTISGANGTYSINIRAHISLYDLIPNDNAASFYGGMVTTSGTDDEFIVLTTMGQTGGSVISVGVFPNLLRLL